MKTFNKNQIFTFNNKAVTSDEATSPIKEQHTEKVIYFSKYPSNKVHHPSKNQSHSFLLVDHINNELHSKNINEDYYNKFLEKLVTDEHNEKPTTYKRNSNKKSTQIYQIQRSQSNKNFVNYKSGNRLIVGQLSINKKNNNNSHLNFRNNNHQIIQSKNSLKSNNNNLIFINHHSNSTCQNMSSINNRRVNSISLGYPYHPSFTEHKRQHSRYHTPKCSTPFNNKNSRSLRNGCVLLNKATYKFSIGDDIEKEGNIKNSKTIPGNGFFINGNLNKDYKLNYQLANNITNNNNNKNCNVFTSSDVDSDKNKKTKIKHKVLEYNNNNNNSKLQHEINNEDIKEQDILKKKNKHLWCCIPFCSQ